MDSGAQLMRRQKGVALPHRTISDVLCWGLRSGERNWPYFRIGRKGHTLERQPRIVAVVEDDPSMRRSLERLLNAHGFMTEGYSSAETFLGRDPAHHLSCVVRTQRAHGGAVDDRFRAALGGRPAEARVSSAGVVRARTCWQTTSPEELRAVHAGAGHAQLCAVASFAQAHRVVSRKTGTLAAPGPAPGSGTARASRRRVSGRVAARR